MVKSKESYSYFGHAFETIQKFSKCIENSKLQFAYYLASSTALAQRQGSQSSSSVALSILCIYSVTTMCSSSQNRTGDMNSG